MTKHEIKICPHCQQYFECKCGDIINCQCESVELKQKHRDYIYQQYDDCLCAGCMIILRREFNVRQFYNKIDQLVTHK